MYTEVYTYLVGTNYTASVQITRLNERLIDSNPFNYISNSFSISHKVPARQQAYHVSNW